MARYNGSEEIDVRDRVIKSFFVLLFGSKPSPQFPRYFRRIEGKDCLVNRSQLELPYTWYGWIDGHPFAIPPLHGD